MTISIIETGYFFFNMLWISCRSTGTQRQYSPYFFNQYEQEIRRVTSDLINTAVAPKPRPVSPNPLRHVHSLLVIGLSYSMLAGCASLTGNRFTLEGQLPANFAIRAQAHYGVANGCEGRSQTRSFERDFEVYSVCCKVCGVSKKNFAFEPVSDNPEESQIENDSVGQELGTSMAGCHRSGYTMTPVMGPNQVLALAPHVLARGLFA